MEKNQKNPLWDSMLPLEERLAFLIKEMTLDEKLQCLTTTCPEIKRLGITPFYLGGEAAHGIEARHDQEFNLGEPEETTSFPQPIGMSATWDPELIKEVGKAVGREARVLYQRHLDGGLCRWAPTVDMERDPRWGRTEEGYGEDPYLTGKMASAYILGMRGEDPFYLQCGATLKHFYANNKEENRVCDSSSIDPRCKYEYYLEPYRYCITEGKAEAVMTAYNEVNGVPCIVNQETEEILRNQYGLPGHIVCDGGDMMQTVTEHHFYQDHFLTIANGLRAGIDCFTDNRNVVYEAAKEAYKRNLITIEDINRSIRHSFSTRIRLGLYDNTKQCPYNQTEESYLNCLEHKKLSLTAAEEAVVLLKNENKILPLRKENTSKIAVIGPLANAWYQDWYGGIPPYKKTLLDGIKEQKSEGVSWCNGYDQILLACGDQYVGLDSSNRLILTDKRQAEKFQLEEWGFGNTLIYALGAELYVKANEEKGYLEAVSKEAFSWYIKEAFDFQPVKSTNQEKDKESYFLQTWNQKQLFWDSSGYLKIMNDETDQKDENKAVFQKIVLKSGLTTAKQNAQNAEIVICAVGCHPMINSKEEIDRTDIILPEPQERLIKELYKVNKNIVMVLISNYPYAIVWEQEHLPAILWSPSGSQEMGSAIARILFGKVSPAGRLNMTWYLKKEDLPPMEEYDIIRMPRTYQYFEKKVLYPFGHGLSYTSFYYDNLEVKLGKDRSIEGKVTVINTGKEIGEEVVQIYIHQETSRAKRPRLQLKAFQRLKNIKPQESRIVSFMIPLTELKYYDVVTGSMILEQSEYRILAGASSQDIKREAVISIPGRILHKRDAFQFCRVEHYDSCEGTYLFQGHEETVGGYKRKESIFGKFIYYNMLFTQRPERCLIKLHGESKREERICVFLNGEKIGSCKTRTKEKQVICQLQTSKSYFDESCIVEIVLEGKTGMEGFIFQQ